MNKLFKKIVITGTSLIFLAALSGCALFQSTQDNTQKVKELENQVKELQNTVSHQNQATSTMQTTASVTITGQTQTQAPASTQSQMQANTPEVTTPAAYTGESFITMTTPVNETAVYAEPVQFKGKVSPDTVKITVNATNSTSTKVDDYVLQAYKPGSTTFSYGAAGKYNNLQEGTNTYVFTAYFKDGSTKSTSLTTYYTPGGAEMGKPVIYLYPTKETRVYVNVKPTNGISISDPVINNGWNVVATPEGQLTNLADNKVYPYLFWEGYAANFVTPKEGFVIAKNEVPGFFDAKLSYMGLNNKEIADFKEYWVPKLAEKPYYFITFIDQESIDRYAPLTVTPKPDSVIRVFFDYKGLDQKVNVPAQELKACTRTGFTVTEWGGRLYR